MSERVNNSGAKKKGRRSPAPPPSAKPSPGDETGTKFSPELASTVLVDALYRGDRIAADAWGVTDRTVRTWRVRLTVGTDKADDTLRTLFIEKRAIARSVSNEDTAETLAIGRAAIRTLAIKAQNLPDIYAIQALEAIAAPYSVVQNGAQMDRMIDERILALTVANGKAAGQLGTDPAATPESDDK